MYESASQYGILPSGLAAATTANKHLSSDQTDTMDDSYAQLGIKPSKQAKLDQHFQHLLYFCE